MSPTSQLRCNPPRQGSVCELQPDIINHPHSPHHTKSKVNLIKTTCIIKHRDWSLTPAFAINELSSAKQDLLNGIPLAGGCF